MTVRGDALPAALNLLGLVLFTRQAPTRWQAPGSAALFALAFAAKPTAASGFMTALLVSALCGRRTMGRNVLALTLVGYAAVVAAMGVTSHGRAFDVLGAGATAGAGWSGLLGAPSQFADQLTYEPLATVGCALFALTLTALLSWRWDAPHLTPPLFLLSTAATTAIIYGTPATIYNHLLDLEVACILTFVSWVALQDERDKTIYAGWMAVTALLALPSLFPLLRRDGASPKREQMQQVARLVASSPKPMLAENPLVPLLAGQTPYVLDLVVFRVLNERDPSFAEPLRKKLREKGFSAVVLIEDPQSETGRVWYQSMHFGPGIVEEVERNYRLVSREPGQLAYLPRAP
jgi:hypothetical protein